jgi:hypothetical protein
MNKKEMKKYVDERISNRLYSKIHYGEYEVQHYFKNRHKGLAGIDSQQTFDLTYSAIRDLKVWRTMKMLCTTNNYIK